MPTPTDTRKARFRAALALARMTADDFATANDITPSHLSQVLAGKRDSATLTEKIEAFINEYLPANARVAASA